MKESKGISRRQFVKSAAVLGAGVATSGALVSPALAQAESQCGIPTKWDYEADVVVVGYGGAGACAAIAAHDAKAQVIVLEKAPHGGGNTGCAMGVMFKVANPEKAVPYYKAMCFGTVEDEELVLAVIEGAKGLSDKLTALGAAMEDTMEYEARWPNLPSAPTKGDNPLTWFNIKGRSGEALFKFLDEQVTKRKIPVLFETPATSLIQDPMTKEIVGVKAASKGKAITVKANRGVVMALGGFENNPEMKGDFMYPGVTIYPWGTPYNTGDGIKMMSEIGAPLCHMMNQEWMGLAVKPASEEVGVALNLAGTLGPYIFVNKYGQRFMPESRSFSHYKGTLEILRFDHSKSEYPNLPAYLVFDETYRLKGPLSGFVVPGYPPVGYNLVHKLYEWSEDNSAEIEKGWILQADTIAELAEKAGIDAEGLQATVDKYNKMAEAKKDTEFGRAEAALFPITEPPYYVTELALAMINTMGGPKHNAKAEVIGVNGDPIPRLYAAGEFGSFFGFLYEGAGNIPEALSFGFIAGEQAAALEPLA